jgi:hypothetical protein
VSSAHRADQLPRRVAGAAQQTSLPAVRSCAGDIGNANGNLTCNYARAVIRC